MCDKLLPSPVKTLFVVGGDKVLVEGAIKLKFKFKFKFIVFEWKTNQMYKLRSTMCRLNFIVFEAVVDVGFQIKVYFLLASATGFGQAATTKDSVCSA